MEKILYNIGNIKNKIEEIEFELKKIYNDNIKNQSEKSPQNEDNKYLSQLEFDYSNNDHFQFKNDKDIIVNRNKNDKKINKLDTVQDKIINNNRKNSGNQNPLIFNQRKNSELSDVSSRFEKSYRIFEPTTDDLSILSTIYIEDQNWDSKQKEFLKTGKKISGQNIISHFLRNDYNLDQYSQLKIIDNTDLAISINNLSINIFIYDNSDFIQNWNLLIIITLIFLIISFPFEQFSERWINSNYQYTQLNMLLEQILIIDFILSFITSYRDEYGKLITNNKLIIINYLETWFIIDLIAIIPTINIIQFAYKGIVEINFIKLPKYLRVVKGFLNMNKLKNQNFNIILGSQTNTEQFRIQTLTKNLIQFLLVSNILVCQQISQITNCVNQLSCQNWFMFLMEREYQMALQTNNTINHSIAKLIEDTFKEDMQILNYQKQIIEERRFQVQIDAWQYVIQTVTTVGYGDIETYSTQERLQRVSCMIFGVVIYSFLTASMAEIVISESMDVQRKNEHALIIEKLQDKYKISGDSRNQLNLLGNSVQTEQMVHEIEFVKLLPRQMSTKVINSIWEVQLRKLHVLDEESQLFFIEFMRLAQFRRCVYEEVIGENEKLTFIQSGQVGLQVNNLEGYLKKDQLYYLGIGDETGYQLFLQPEASQNWEYHCVINTEVIEMDPEEFLAVMKFSLKGQQYIQYKVWNQIIDLYMILSLYQSMMRKGVYFDVQWYNKALELFKFKRSDFVILDKIQNNLQNIELGVNNQHFRKNVYSDKWFSNVMNNEIYRHVQNKAKDSINTFLLQKFDELKTQSYKIKKEQSKK